MGNSSSSPNHRDNPYESEHPSQYASEIIRKTSDFRNANGGLKRTGNGPSCLSSTTSSASTNGPRYIPNMKSGDKGLVMPRGGAPLHGHNAPQADPSTAGYTSPDSWGFHINITPNQELYASSGVPAGPLSAPSSMEGKRNHVFQNLQNSNKTNMGWTSVPI
jgi:hypothetical protein